MKLIIITIFLLSGLNQNSKVVFDIPALKNKSIIQIRKILGKPKIDDIPTNYQIKAGAYGDAFFEKAGFTLEVTYNPTNGKVNDFFISKEDAISDYKILEMAGNVLKSNDFFLKPVHSNKNPLLYTGITVTPQ